MQIKILGTGCPNCQKLETNTKKALEELKMTATLEKVTDIGEIMSYGIMSSPALVVDEEVKSFGKVLESGEIKELLQNNKKSGGCCSCKGCC